MGFRTSDSSFSSTVGTGSCRALAGNDAGWFVAYRSEPPERLLFTVTDDRGVPQLDPSYLRTDTDPTYPEGVTVTAFRDGFAWALTPDRRRRLEIGLIHADLTSSRIVIDDVFGAPSPPAIAPWPFDPEGALAIVAHAPHGVRPYVVDVASGRERFRSDPFAFSMGRDVTPALSCRGPTG